MLRQEGTHRWQLRYSSRVGAVLAAGANNFKVKQNMVRSNVVNSDLVVMAASSFNSVAA